MNDDQNSNPDSKKSIGQHITVKVQGQSMSPLIRDGEEVKFKLFDLPVAIDEIEDGKVALFKDDDEWVAHRVLKMGQDVWLKGDYSQSKDAKISYAFGVATGFDFESVVGSWLFQNRFFVKSLAKANYYNSKDKSIFVRKGAHLLRFLLVKFFRALISLEKRFTPREG